MVAIEEEEWYLSLCEELNDFCKKVVERIDKEQKQLKECEERHELESKLEQEHKLNAELTQQLAKLNHRSDDLERACAKFSKLSITDNDQQKLNNLQLSLRIVKEITSIRFDFSATDKMKGYIKSESRRLLVPFELNLAEDTDVLWEALRTGVVSKGGKENKILNHN